MGWSNWRPRERQRRVERARGRTHKAHARVSLFYVVALSVHPSVMDARVSVVSPSVCPARNLKRNLKTKVVCVYVCVGVGDVCPALLSATIM